jgi:hypothetical protein
MNGIMVLYMSQYGDKFYSKNLRDLQKQVGGGRISKMYNTTKGGVDYHCGYVVGDFWLTAYIPFKGI